MHGLGGVVVVLRVIVLLGMVILLRMVVLLRMIILLGMIVVIRVNRLVGVRLRPDLQRRVRKSRRVTHFCHQPVLNENVLEFAVGSEAAVRRCPDFVERTVIVTQYLLESFLIFRGDISAGMNLDIGLVKADSALPQTHSSARTQRYGRPSSQKQ